MSSTGTKKTTFKYVVLSSERISQREDQQQQDFTDSKILRLRVETRVLLSNHVEREKRKRSTERDYTRTISLVIFFARILEYFFEVCSYSTGFLVLKFVQKSCRKESTHRPSVPLKSRKSGSAQCFDTADHDATMSQNHDLPNNLDQCVQTLKSISKNLTSQSPRTVADLYISIVGLLCHLKTDQAFLQKTRHDDPNTQHTERCPSPDKIPAMTVVIQDSRLFQALLKCLKPITAEMDVNTKHMHRGALTGTATGDHQHNHHHHHHSQVQGRKRSYSLSSDVDSSAKAIKLSHSPNIGRLTYQKKQQQQQQQQLEGSCKQPSFNVQAVAATILFTAFQHLDHWPVPLIKAYAEDCFGPRLWVDDDRCRLFVENLSLAHHNKDDDEKVVKNIEISDEYFLADASRVADSYRNFKEREDDITETNQPGWPRSPQLQQQQRGGSHGAAASSISVNPAKFLSNDSKLPESVEKEECNSSKRTLSKMVDKANASDSSSGEEDEEVVVTTESFGDDAVGGGGEGDAVGGGGEAAPSPGTQVESPTKPSSREGGHNLYPIKQQKLNLSRVRQRYFGVNHECAQYAIFSSLSDRLDAKAKQNSLLLQSLQSFTSLSSVRRLISGYLERWLQSPGLSNLARALFTSTVKMMKNVDPPLPDDLWTIDNILAMRLKANQLNFHLENVTAIASGIPTPAVTNHIYLRLLRKVLQKMDSTDNASASEHLKMISAVHTAIKPSLSSDGIAASLLNMMVNPVDDSSDRKELSRLERNQLVKKLRSLIRLIASQLGQSFDGCRMVESLLSYDVRTNSWSIRDEEDKARLMFQCAMLLVHRSNKAEHAVRHQQKLSRRADVLPDATSLKRDPASLKKNLLISRKLLLTWCCNDYGHLCLSKKTKTQCKRWHWNGSKKNSKTATEVVGAGPPDYRSILGGQGATVKKAPRWFAVSRCVLFMEKADSTELQRFIYPDESIVDNESDWQDMRYRIDQCCANGADLDDEMIWITLKSSALKDGGISPEVTLPLLENLFECCNKNRSSMLRLTDERLVWALYNLVEFEAPKPRGIPDSQLQGQKEEAREEAKGGQFEDAEEDSEEKKKDLMEGNGQTNGLTKKAVQNDFPRLAYPGTWWRVTVIVLVICGASPGKIAATVWNDHPTVQAMIKMVISGRYRFPTVDCDDECRDGIKKAEQSIRDEEARVAELLFLPPAPKKEKVKKSIEASYGGSRMSARQREKREKKLQREREKAASKAAEVANRRRKQLKTVQKSIMLWDPKGPARKPPREAAELLLAVEDLFGLSEVFQRSLAPDFLLKTIGETTRGAIERAYHWLIPIISQVPDTIARLPPSASCFLLLRACGTEGDEQAQLKELSAPLLRHVSESLKGNLGELDAIRAFDLLMTDVASHNPDRRRSGRRVLKDAIGQLDDAEEQSAETKSTSIPSWILNILRVKHAKGLVGDAIRHMSTAITFERGRVLRSFLIGLEKIVAFANLNSVGEWNFASVLIDLISSRQSVCAEAMDAFPDLRSLAIRIVHEEFSCYVENPSKQNTVEPEAAVIMNICHSGDHHDVRLPLSVLRSASVLLSIWKEDDSLVSNDAASAVNDLVSMLMRPYDAKHNGSKEACDIDGFASAKALGSGESAVSVESWVMLAKSRSDAIAKRAALTAPTGYLPRLLLCSGLARASLLTMIDRIGMMGDNVEDRDKVFRQLLAPSMTREWDIGRISHHREVTRKLLGRLSAYLRLHEISLDKEEENISTTFLSWLSDECKIHEKRNKKVKSKSKSKMSSCLLSVGDASSLLSKFSDEHLVQIHDINVELTEEDHDDDMNKFRTLRVQDIESPQDSKTSAYIFIENCMKMSKPNELEKWLGDEFTQYTKERENPKVEENKTEETDPLAFLAAVAQSEEIDLSRLASSLLRSYLSRKNQQDGVTRIILTWVPFLSRACGSAELWRLLFSVHSDAFENTWDALLSSCSDSWCPSHVVSCCEWILSRNKNISPFEFSLDRMVRFLVLASRQHSVQIESFMPTTIQVKNSEHDFPWGASQEFVIAAASIALGCMKHGTKGAVGDLPADYCSRNDLPDWLILLLLLARCGAKQMKLVCEAVLEGFSQSGSGSETKERNNQNVLRAVILRLYACNPYGMNLSIAKIRTALMEAAEMHCEDWLRWRSPLDDQLQDMIDSVAAGAGQKMIRPLADMSKKHPLLILRKVKFFIKYLEEDATYQGEQQRAGGGGGVVGGNDKRGIGGVVDGHSLSGKLEAIMPSGKKVAVAIRHWGFSYTESIWVALLDVVFAVPGPVLFRCGLKMGLLDYLNVNLQLLFMQSQLRRKEKESRLREKLNDFLKAFQSINASGWDNWLESKMSDLPSFGEIRNVLMCLNFISPEQAMMHGINKKKRGTMTPEKIFDPRNKKRRINKAA